MIIQLPANIKNMPNVIIYSTPVCVYCKKVKEFLDKKKVPYQEKNVATDIPAREEMLRKTAQFGVPVVDIDGKIILGFDKAKMEELLLSA